MNTRTTVLVVVVAVVGVCVADIRRDPTYVDPTAGRDPIYRSSNYGRDPYYPVPTRSAVPSYGRSPSYGYGNTRYNYQPSPVVSTGREPLDEVDKLYRRLESVLAQVKAYSEQFEALSARLSQQTQFLDTFSLVTLVALNQTDTKQNFAIKSLDDHVDSLMDEVSEQLTPSLEQLRNLNNQNTQDQQALENFLTVERLKDVLQERDINNLRVGIANFKGDALQMKENSFAVVDNVIERNTARLMSARNKELSRHCESGQVTLSPTVSKAVYQYQTTFQDVPQVTYGLCGFNANLNSLDDPSVPYYGGYNTHHPQTEPEAIGGRVVAYSSKTGVTMQAFDLSFGDTKATNVDVCFQACSIGPGSGDVVH